MPRGRPKGAKDKQPRKKYTTLADRGLPSYKDRKVAAALANPETVLCACNCGLPATLGKKYKRGHRPRDLPCKCGCGEICKPGCEYIFGHQWVGKERPEMAGDNNPAAKQKESTGQGYGRPLGAKDGPDADRSVQIERMSGADNPMRNAESLAKLVATQQTDAYRENHAKGLTHAHTIGFTGLNDRVEARLKAMGLKGFEREYLLRFWRADFAWPADKVALDVQGCRWHCCEKHPEAWDDRTPADVHKQHTRDRVKREQLERMGWTVIYLWEHDVLSGTVQP